MSGPIRNWTPRDLPDLTGKTFVITGANSGIGLGAAKILAEAGGAITMLCRNRAKAEAAADVLRAGRGANAPVSIIALDLADLASVRSAAAEILETTPAIDALVNNAGMMTPPKRRTTRDGFELQFGVNHLGHFLLTGLLKDRVIESGGRVVVVSSLAHKYGPRAIRFDDPNWAAGYRPWDAYSQSKFANAMFGAELDRRLKEAGHAAQAMICHPGYAATNLQFNGSGGLMAAASIPGNLIFAQSARRGAFPTALSAADPRAQGGAFYGPTGLGELRGRAGDCQLVAEARDPEVAARLWALSEEATGHAWTV